METLGDAPVNLVLLSQRLNFPPVGRQGGQNGSVERLFLNGEPVQGTWYPLTYKAETFLPCISRRRRSGDVKLRAEDLAG